MTSRFFLELQYKGTAYSGFQTQQNANTVQDEVEKALRIILKTSFVLTGSSRTDAGVHARQNFFHFDRNYEKTPWAPLRDVQELIYKLNAVLPEDIVVHDILEVNPDAHCRFDALSRDYRYYIYRTKNPFLRDRAYFFPFKLDISSMRDAAAVLKEYTDFTSFSKRNTQVKSFLCRIETSEWLEENGMLVYHIRANRFLRGMVRALTATMLRVGRGRISITEFRQIIEAKDCTKASFAVPPQGLFLDAVTFP